jgi:hypothetical protein
MEPGVIAGSGPAMMVHGAIHKFIMPGLDPGIVTGAV